jgi:membrane protein DedA with SNARE-associated domain
MIPLETLLKTYGYWAVLIGTFAEGETVLVLGGFAAHRGYMVLPWVILAAFVGSLMGDQLFFYLGRKHTQWVLARRPSWKARIDRAHQLLERFRTLLILGFRFMYGLRTIIPFLIGMSSVSTRKFIILDVIAAFVWAVAVGTGGYLFGNILEIILGDIKHYELPILGAIAIIGLLLWALHRHHYRKKRAGSVESSSDS